MTDGAAVGTGWSLWSAWTSSGTAIGPTVGHRQRGEVQFERMVFHDGDSLIDDPFDPSKQSPFFAVAERQGESLGTGSRRAADAVNVVFGFHRQVFL